MNRTINEPYLPDPGRTVDRRQRAFRNLDTSHIDGDWVEESQYNRHNHGKGVLVGNWQEEATIDTNLSPKQNRGPPHLNEQQHFRRGKNSATVATDLTGKTTTFFADYINTTPKEKEKSTMMITGNDEEFKKSLNSRKYNPPALPKEENVIGRRKKMEERQLLEQAAKELDQQEQLYSEAHKRAVLEESYKTTYHVEHERNVPPLSNSMMKTNETYKSDIPITFHTEQAKNQNPLNSLLHTNIYHSAQVSSTNPWNRNTTFTKPISEYRGGTTKN